MAIKKLQNNYTTPEQSKRLLELGVPADSADFYYHIKDNNEPIHVTTTYTEWIKSVIDGANVGIGILKILGDNEHLKLTTVDDFIPCWSVGRLMEIYDTCVENTESWPTVKQDISYVINTIVAIDCAVKDGRIDFLKLED